MPAMLTTTDMQKPGAPRGNRNRLRSGKHARQSLVLGVAPAGMRYAVTGARGVMEEIRRAVVAVRNETTVFDESLILELGEWEVHRRLCWRLLRVEAGKLTVDQQVSIRRDAAKAASERSRILKALGLDKHHEDDPWAVLRLPETELDSPSLASDSAAARATSQPDETMPTAATGDATSDSSSMDSDRLNGTGGVSCESV